MSAGFNPVMSFAAAAAPFTKETYSFEGHVGKDGKVKGGGLGCSGYASVVLQRMNLGEDWLKPGRYNVRAHYDYGDRMAATLGLDLTATVPAADIRKSGKEFQAVIKAHTLTPGGLYFFNARKETHGHVGFVRVQADGRLTQSHYSGVAPYNGLASGEFRDWYQKSMYRNEPVELYRVREP